MSTAIYHFAVAQAELIDKLKSQLAEAQLEADEHAKHRKDAEECRDALRRESDGLHDLFDKEHAQLVDAEREVKRLKDRIEVMERARRTLDEVSFSERCSCGRPTWTDHYHLRCLGCDRRLGECACGPFGKERA